MVCPHCQSPQLRKLNQTTDFGYAEFRCGGCLRKSNERKGTPFNYLEFPTDIVFEVDPSRVEGLTLEMWRNEVISGYQQRVRIPLGITAANANQWRDAARGWGIDISLSNSTRPIP